MSQPTHLDDITDEQTLASAVRFLIDGGEEEAARILLSCHLSWEIVETYSDFGIESSGVLYSLRGSREAYDVLSGNNPTAEAVERALAAVLPSDCYLKRVVIRAEVVNIDPNWRAELLEIARGRGINNQGVDRKATKVWSNLRFRSVSEVKIAEALDRAGVLFLPNCKGRLGGETTPRQNREADFLVCHAGKWGILEVDGEPFHPPSRAAEDHERDRLFREHGVRVVEHFDATKCYERPDAVVGQFLSILAKL